MMDKKPLVTVTKKDLIVETFRSGGKGGQHQNKTSSGVRIKHPDSGAVAECRENREQSVNKKIAFRRLVSSDKFQNWLKFESSKAMGMHDEITRKVKNQLNVKYIKVDEYDVANKRWVSTPVDEFELAKDIENALNELF
jgi:protein subunit release factor B